MTRADEGILIVGAGFAGLGMAIRLQQAGIRDFTILEREPRIGGVWRDNHYPGAACDIESHLYSFSFEPNPDWSRTYGPQAEILGYLERCADKYGLRPHLRLGTAVTGASFDERARVWDVQTSDGRSIRARVVISGSGHALSKPVYPDLAGRETFAGKAMHSACWDDAYPLEGKTVAVVGTGASAIQIVPSIAERVGRMFVFQRTPPWIIPRPDRDVSPRERALFRRHPSLQRLARAAQYVRHELSALAFIVDPRIMKLGERIALRHLEAQVRDPALREKLTPAYRMGCKRVLISNDYYPAIARDHVELVTERIAEIRPEGVVTSDGRVRRADAIVYATGFETAEAKPPFRILGRGGRDLNDAWTGGVEAYLGTTISGFPNLFLIVGPNTGLGHSSMIFMMESQFAYVLDAIRMMRARRLELVDVRREVQARYNAELEERFARTVWATGGCKSWYLTRDGKNTTLWPGSTIEFRMRTRRFDARSYEMIGAGGVEVRRGLLAQPSCRGRWALEVPWAAEAFRAIETIGATFYRMSRARRERAGEISSRG